MLMDEDALIHYGTKRHSGRYPWGSGGNEPSRSEDFLGYVDHLRSKGMTESEIAKGIGLDTGDPKYNTARLRAAISIANNERSAVIKGQVEKLKSTGMSNTAIAKELSLSEGSVRNYLKEGDAIRTGRLTSTANILRDEVNKHELIDIGNGVEHYLGITRTRLNNAVALLQEEGYGKHYVKIPQLGTNHETTLIVLSKKDMKYGDVYKKRFDIRVPNAISTDQGLTYTPRFTAPKSYSSKKIEVIYKEDGGSKADGVIYIRPGVDDLSLGGRKYAQVRIMVDGTHYLKGMAVYKEDLPAGVDIQFNTNKTSTGNKLDAMKKVNRKEDGSVDMENPFTSSIARQHGVMNIVNEQGSWETWGKVLSSQFLSKQAPKLAQEQLAMTFESKMLELNEIRNLNNPTVRKHLLEEFADSADSSAVHLKAAGLPRTAAHVILPLGSIKPNEIYAPGYKDGERVVLVRHPHGGTFEIPELVVNNRNREGRKTIGLSKDLNNDAVGIHHTVAEKLSGADFDGDTVLVIPNNKNRIKTSPSLKALKDFDPHIQYKKYEGMRVIGEKEKQIEMGKVTNLISDMTIKGAGQDEIAQAIRHSMVVIDAGKHELNWKQSEIDNNIKALKKKWQSEGKKTGTPGAATIISRAGSPVRIPDRKQLVRTNPDTGEKIYTPSGKTYVNSKGETVAKTIEIKRLEYATDARTLVSGNGGTAIEHLYADHSNKLKALANQARKEAYHTPNIETSSSAKAVYAKEVTSLKAKLAEAQRNAPLERQAQLLGNATVRLKKQENPNMDKDALKKTKNQALLDARLRVGAKKLVFDITQEEWNAIQSGAVSNEVLKQLLKNANPDRIKELSTPRTRLLMTPTKIARAKTMLANGYTQAEVAEHLGVSLTTLKTGIRGK